MENISEEVQRSPVKKSHNQSGCLSRWWNQDFTYQKHLGTFLEHPLFHLLITILVIIECASVIIEILLHSVKRQKKCDYVSSYPNYQLQIDIHKLKQGMQIAHYTSLSILSIFLFEILLKIFALGYHYWKCRENHMLDYFDAILVSFSFSVEIYFLIVDKESVLGHSALLIVVLRLWHIIRIANAAVQCFQNGEEFRAHRRKRHARNSSKALLLPSSIQAILGLMQEKTECLRRDVIVERPLVDRFEDIDQKCYDAFEHYYGNELKLVQEIQKINLLARRIEKKGHDTYTV